MKHFVLFLLLVGCSPKSYVPVYFIQPKDKVEARNGRSTAVVTSHYLPPTEYSHTVYAKYDSIQHRIHEKPRNEAAAVGIGALLIWWLILALTYN